MAQGGVMFLALKEMKKDKGRFVLIIGIVALISYLVFFLTGLAYGLAKDNTTAVESWDAQKIILNKGTNSNILSSMMEATVLEDFQGEEFSPINLARSVAYKNGSETDTNTIDLVLVGMNQDSPSYPEVIEGEKPSNKDDVLASISLKEEDGIEVGDTLVLSMNDREFVVSGFTDEVKFNVSSVVYTDLYEASASMLTYRQQQKEEAENKEAKSENQETTEAETSGEQNQEAEQHTEADQAQDSQNQGEQVDATSSATQEVPQRISGVLAYTDDNLDLGDKYDVINIKDFIIELPGYLAQVLTFGLMIGFLILISTIVLGVFIYIITMQKKQTFGIMKIQGISNGYIAKSVIIQTFLVSFIGTIIGFVLTIISDYALPSTVPFRFNGVFFLFIGIFLLVISLLGAIFSVRGVTKVDPLEVLD